MMRVLLGLLVFASGLAALSWEVLWQLQATLALGLSALGTAITLAATMCGMTLGSAIAGRILQRWPVQRPARAYAVLEMAIGLGGLLVAPGFVLLEALDTAAHAGAPALAPWLRLIGIFVLLGPAALALGATVPVFGALAPRHGTSLPALYGLNMAGAAIGTLLVAFVVLPKLGVALTVRAAATLNLTVALVAWLLPAPAEEAPLAGGPSSSPEVASSLRQHAGLVAFTTGFVTFGLEVAWFRALRAAFQSATDSFAVMLVAVLLPLAAGAGAAPWLRRRGIGLPALLTAAGVAVVVVTPIVERVDTLTALGGQSYAAIIVGWLGFCLAVVGVPVLLIGTVLPWLLGAHPAPAAQGRLYAINTLGACAGSLGAAWVLLPAVGYTRSSWALGIVLVVLGAALGSRRLRALGALGAAGALAVALAADSGVGRLRVPGRLVPDYRVVAYGDGPDSTISVVAYADGRRLLVIDGFNTAEEGASAHYMRWMGHLPMMAHPAPRRALVICFGTGQTANAVREEGPEALDIVELNAEVLRLARHFPANRGVLSDPRVRTVVMDGRAWLRRADRTYDVITLEPMPPSFAGVNALYSLEFYQRAAERLEPGGVIAQWMPFHILPPYHAASVAATFRAVFPDAALWVDPVTTAGILIGRRAGAPRPLAEDWRGLSRAVSGRDLEPAAVRAAVRLDALALARYAARGVLITDDNQLLAYGRARAQQIELGPAMVPFNLQLVEQARMRPTPGTSR